MPIVKLKTPSSWQYLEPGLLASGERVALERVEDDFAGSVLDSASFGSVLSGAPLFRQDSGVHIKTPGPSDAAILYVKKPVDKSGANTYSMRFRLGSLGTNAAYPVFVQQSAPAPVVATASALSPLRVVEVYVSSTGMIYVIFFNSSGALLYWNGAAWTQTPSYIASYSAMRLYEASLEWDPSHWRMRVEDVTGGTVLAQTSYVAWSATRDTGGGAPLWFAGGDPFTDYYAVEMLMERFRERYAGGPLRAVMGPVNVGTAIEQIPITAEAESGASLRWRYDAGSGWVTPAGGTLADLRSALVGTAPVTLDIEASFESDGEGGASFDINGGAISSGSGLGAVFNMPLEVVQLAATEVIEL